MRRTKPGAALLGVLLLLGLVAGCGQGTSEAGPTVAVRSALGTAQVPVNPKRVVAIGWGSQDAALALGVVPVGIPDYRSDSGTADGILPWDRPLLRGQHPTLLDVNQGNLPIEDIAKLHPDVILAVYSGIDAGQYAQLSRIAPTVGYPGKPWATSWQDQLAMVGTALGRSAQAQQLRTKTEATITAAAAAHPAFRGRTILFGSQLQPGAFNVYHADDPRVVLLRDLGFSVDPMVATLKAGAGTKAFATPIAAENLGSITANVLVAWYPSEQVRRTAEAQPLFGALPAVRSGAYVPLTDPPFVFATSTANVLSLPWMLDRYLPRLQEAVAHVPAATG